MWVHLQLPPQHCCVSCFPIPNPEINHRDSSAGIPPSRGGTRVPVPCPEPRAPQRCHPAAATGKGQGMLLLRSPPRPAHPDPSQALSPRSSFPVVFWACLFAAFADSAQPCCPPDSSRSSGHGTHPAHSPEPCQLTCAPAGSATALSPAQAQGPAVPPHVPRWMARAAQETPKPPPVLTGSSQNVLQDHRALKGCFGGRGCSSWGCSQLSQRLLLSLQLCQPQRGGRGD